MTFACDKYDNDDYDYDDDDVFGKQDVANFTKKCRFIGITQHKPKGKLTIFANLHEFYAKLAVHLKFRTQISWDSIAKYMNGLRSVSSLNGNSETNYPYDFFCTNQINRILYPHKITSHNRFQ